MKRNLMMVIAVLPLAVILSAAEKTGQPEGMQVEDQIAELNKMVIPPEGTEKANVDSVYGEPREVKELKGKGQSADYPMHVYELLPPVAGQESRAFLYVTYRDNRARRAGVNHLCVLKNRGKYREGSAEAQRQRREMEEENLLVLKDLKDICGRFADKLRDASWNKKE